MIAVLRQAQDERGASRTVSIDWKFLTFHIGQRDGEAVAGAWIVETRIPEENRTIGCALGEGCAGPEKESCDLFIYVRTGEFRRPTHC